MNGNKNNKLLYDPEEINRKNIENIYRNQNPYDDEEDDEEEVEDAAEEYSEEENDELENEDNTKEEINNSEATDSAGSQKLQKAVNAVQKTAEVAQKAAKAADAAKKSAKLAKIGAFVAAHWPIILGVVGIIAVIIIIVILIYGADSEQGKYSANTIGLMGYEYLELENVCEDITVVEPDGSVVGTYDLETYVAGVISGEVQSMDDDTTYEVMAINARTYGLRNAMVNDCTMIRSERWQGFMEPTNEKIIAAVNRTRGLVITRDNTMVSGMYDSFCWDEKDDDYYYMCQGNYDTGEPLKMPVEWAEEAVMRFTGNERFLTTPRYRSHGQGMSQHGIYYLSASEGWNTEEIISYYYGKDSKIMSIYQTFAYNGEYPLDPAAYEGLQFLTDTSFSDLLASTGMTIEEFDAYLADVVSSAGVGTRAAVVGSAVSLIGSLAEMGYKLPYQWGGKYYSVGSNPNWGLESSSTSYWCNDYATKYDNISTCTTNYRWNSFDCSGFVNWAIINGFQFNGYDELRDVGAYQITDNYGTIPLDDNSAVCQPGDVLVKTGHIMLVVGLDDANKRYIIAESTGSRLNTGYGGVIIDYESYGNTNYRCRRLDDLYSRFGGSNED